MTRAERPNSLQKLGYRIETFPVVKIRATCPQCDQDVELTSVDVTALVCADTGDGSYAFRCPECEIAVSVDADMRIDDLLVDRGVKKRIWTMPAELAEHHTGPKLSYDDLLDLHFVLQRDGWFSELEAMTVSAMVPTTELTGFLATHDGRHDDVTAVAERFKVSPWIAGRALGLAREHLEAAE